MNLLHRGACGCEANTGDGAGILVQMPDAFLRKVAPARAAAGRRVRRRARVPAAARPSTATALEQLFARIVAEEGQQLLGWRDVPTDDRPIGPSAVAVEPVFRQVFIGAATAPRALRSRGSTRASFERKLYVIRKRIEHAVDRAAVADEPRSSSTSSACRANTLIYKGMLTASQIETMFPDLADPTVRVGAGARAPALQHQHVPVVAARASVPLHRAQRRDQHADAATSTGCARAKGCCQSALLGDDLKKILPIIREGGSDTATFDNVLEFLVMTGPLAAARDPDDDPGAVAEPRERCRPSCRRSTSTTRR